MPSVKTSFSCTICGFVAARWLGRCPHCEAWNSLVESAPPPPGRIATQRTKRGPTLEPIRLADVVVGEEPRRATGMSEFDRLLGGGLVPGSLVLVGGPPGTGKSTLLLQLADLLSQRGARVVYVSAEESASQTRLRAERLGVHGEILLFAQTDLRAILEAVDRIAPDVLIVDSIQTVALPEVESIAGSVAQVRECTAALMSYAKRSACATFLVGHVTKDGQLAGPRLLEHLVDVVLAFEGEPSSEHRIVRASKNRFGSVDEICVLAMEAAGLREIANPSELFLGGDPLTRRHRPSGACIFPCIVGSRPVLVEIEALVGESAAGNPRRLAANLDPSRLAMIVAILERRAGLRLGGFDIYASVAGGLRVNEPAADLALALAIASSLQNRPVIPGLAAFGELGLSGEVRPVGATPRRIIEAQRLGFANVLRPHNPTQPPVAFAVTTLAEALHAGLVAD